MSFSPSLPPLLSPSHLFCFWFSDFFFLYSHIQVLIWGKITSYKLPYFFLTMLAGPDMKKMNKTQQASQAKETKATFEK